MFADASALVAILTAEPEGEMMAGLLDQAAAPITSGIALYETVLAIARKRRRGLQDARDAVDDFLRLSGIRVVAITEREAGVALDAFARFGGGSGHPARLNMGDCFAYASARAADCALLFKGEDFASTDIPSAVTEPVRLRDLD